MTRAALLAALLLLNACMGTDKQHTILGDTLPGISDLDHGDHSDDAWWKKYYGE